MAAFAAQFKLQRLRRSAAALANDRGATTNVFRAATVAEPSDAADTGCGAQGGPVASRLERLSILELFR